MGSACSLALITNLRMPALTAGFWSADCETAGSAHCRHASSPSNHAVVSEGVVGCHTCMSGCPAFCWHRHDVESLQHAHLSMITSSLTLTCSPLVWIQCSCMLLLLHIIQIRPISTNSKTCGPGVQLLPEAQETWLSVRGEGDLALA